MSRYAWFACTDCQIALWLGKIVSGPDGHIHYFSIQSSDGIPNSQQIILNRVLWKMLADHSSHNLRVITDQDKNYEYLDRYAEIGGDEEKDILIEDYIRDWPG